MGNALKQKMLKKFKSRSREDDLFNNDENVSLPQKGVSTSTLISEFVTDFSSQYGSETSISYTASNLAGKSNIYPNYGDFTQACVFRIYGPWWDILPSSRAPFYRTPSTFYSQDYIELSFHKKLYPLKITVYETYNPGCVVRILACETSQDTDVDTGLKYTRWKTLWEGEPEQIPTGQLAARKFCPPLKPCHFPTKMLKKFKSRSREDDLFNNDENVSLPQKGVSTSTLISEFVTDFSSQYGSETSISYTASNLAGKSNIYPNYGDFTQACVFRIYGPWWDILPSSRAPFYRTPSTFYSQDYIELSFHKKLYPLKITVYETYNPGCVVRILACETSQDTDVDTGLKYTRWKTLWEGEPEQIPTGQLAARKFCPPLKPCHFPTNLIRLEMCHHHAYYYTELDCVELTGTKENPYKDAQSEDDELLANLDSLFISENSREVTSSQGLQPSETVSFGEITSDSALQLREITSTTSHTQFDEYNGTHNGEQTDSDNGYFDLMPEEVIQLILSFLDVLSLCRVARTCRLFWKHSYDSLQYTELNLQPHWTQVNDIALDSLQSRGRFLQRLNLSWCHGNILSYKAFVRYLRTSGAGLKDLYLSSCNFLQSETICDIVEHCPNLIELDIGSCRQIESEDLKSLEKLKHIQRLNLYRTMVNTETIKKIIRSCPELRHLNLGSCIRINDYDSVLQELSQHCPNLESLDLWRARTVSHVGIVALTEGCHNLLELDIGWCNEVKSGTNCLIDLVENCTKLKKLFLTANRTVCDADLFAIAEHSHDLEQLDILGTRQVTAHAAQNVMQKCPKLCFFDVSFCSGIDQYMVQIWKEAFPHVAVKRSFQN